GVEVRPCPRLGGTSRPRQAAVATDDVNQPWDGATRSGDHRFDHLPPPAVPFHPEAASTKTLRSRCDTGPASGSERRLRPNCPPAVTSSRSAGRSALCTSQSG